MTKIKGWIKVEKDTWLNTNSNKTIRISSTVGVLGVPSWVFIDNLNLVHFKTRKKAYDYAVAYMRRNP